jgi:hypothetical protein
MRRIIRADVLSVLPPHSLPPSSIAWSQRACVSSFAFLRCELFAYLLPCCSPASADELRALAAGAIAPIVRTVAADFERRSGIHVKVDNATGGVVDKRVRSGEPVDVVVAPEGVLRGLGKDGYLNLTSERAIARVGIAVAVSKARLARHCHRGAIQEGVAGRAFGGNDRSEGGRVQRDLSGEIV